MNSPEMDKVLRETKGHDNIFKCKPRTCELLNCMSKYSMEQIDVYQTRMNNTGLFSSKTIPTLGLGIAMQYNTNTDATLPNQKSKNLPQSKIWSALMQMSYES